MVEPASRRALKSFSVPPNAAPLLLIAIAVAAALLYVPRLLLIIVVLRARHPVRHPHQRWVAARPETWDDKPGQRRQARRRSAGPSRTAARCRGLGLRKPQGRKMTAAADRREDPPLSHLRLTARLNTSALDSRRGVVRLHPEAIAALGMREWDAVSLLGSRSTAAVVGVAPPAPRRAPRCSTM